MPFLMSFNKVMDCCNFLGVRIIPTLSHMTYSQSSSFYSTYLMNRVPVLFDLVCRHRFLASGYISIDFTIDTIHIFIVRTRLYNNHFYIILYFDFITNVHATEMTPSQSFQQRRRSETVGTMNTGTTHFTDAVQTNPSRKNIRNILLNIGFSLIINNDTTTREVGCRHTGQRSLRHIMTKGQAGVVHLRET